MGTVALVVAAAGITVGSRIAALALLPAPRGRVAAVVGRVPPPLFASLAMLTLVGSQPGAVDPPMIAAVGCALLATRWSSLLIALGAGLGGFVVASLVW